MTNKPTRHSYPNAKQKKRKKNFIGAAVAAHTPLHQNQHQHTITAKCNSLHACVRAFQKVLCVYLTVVEKKERTNQRTDLGGKIFNQLNVLLLSILLGETLLLGPGIPLGLALEVKGTLLL